MNDTTLLILPTQNFSKEHYIRIFEWSEYFFKDTKIINVTFDFAKSNIFDINIELFLDTKDNQFMLNDETLSSIENRLNSKIKNIVIARDDNDNNPPFHWETSLKDTIKFYKDNLLGYAYPRDIYKPFEYIYLPYSYLYKFLNFKNDLNMLGFRMDQNFRKFKHRDKNEKLILFFGGSSCFDIFAKIGERFCDFTQQYLNENSQYKYTILNFGLPGNVILNEISYYIMFGMELNPDIVIAHDGFNDLVYGQCSNIELQREYNLNYQCELDIKKYMKECDNRYKVNVPAEIVINTYLSRKYQFQTLVQNNNSIFISSLQPTLYSKKRVAPLENKFEKSMTNEDIKPIFRNIKLLYEKTSYLIQNDNTLSHHIDFDSIFNQYDEKNILFGDVMHTFVEANKIIAQTYCDYIIQNIEKKLC